MSLQSQEKYIYLLQDKLLKHLQWGSVNQWHSTMFNDLSDLIFDSTQVLISAVTLKRFFGVVNHQGSPSITTLNAIAQFLEYDNFSAFKVMHQNKLKRFTLLLSNKSLYVGFGFILALVTISLIANQKPDNIEIPEDIYFASQTVTNEYPNSVIFDFDLKGINTDDIVIQQYWDKTKTIEIDKDQKQATGIYYFPGYFKARLIVNKQSIAEHDLFLKSNGWIGTIEYDPIPEYFNPLESDSVGLGLPSSSQKLIRESEDPLYSVYHYINDLGNVSGDDFKLHASLIQKFDQKWAVCQRSIIYIIGTNGAMIIPFSKLGCISDNNLMVNDLYYSGKKHDLSSFAANFDHWSEVDIHVSEKQLTVHLEGDKRYELKYNESMGRLVGLRFKFLGMGEVKDIRVEDENGRTVDLN